MGLVRLIIKGALHPRARAWAAAAAAMLNTAAVFVFLAFSSGIDLSLARERAFLGADIIFIPAKARYEPEEALMVGAPSGMLMDDKILGVLAQIPEVSRFTPQLYFQSLALGCCSMKEYPLVGFDPRTDFLLKPWLKGERALGSQAVLAGCEAARRSGGGKVMFFGRPFRIRRALPCTGMAVDRTFFIPLDVSREIAGKQLGIGLRDISGVLVKLRRQEQMDYVIEQVEYLMENVKGLRVPPMIRQASERIRLIEKLLGVALLVLAASGIVLLLGVFRLAAEVKSREAALLRALGASGAKVAGIVAGEILIISGAGAATGLAAGAGALAFLKVKMTASGAAAFVFPGLHVLVLLAVASAAAVVLVSVLAGAAASSSALRQDPGTAMKNTR